MEGATEYTVTFTGSTAPCVSTRSFRFSRPPGYRFAAGQYLSLTLATRDGEQSKQFSHCDTPGEQEIRILTRMTGSAFKGALAELVPGDVVTVRGPSGRLVLSDDVHRAAFLVGGVGITPMLSIVGDAVQRSTGLTALVFDANPDEACIPLREEFDVWQRESPSVRFVHILERPPAKWAGESGYITAEIVRRHCDPLDGWHWFVAGPPAMAEAMRAVLVDLGVPDDRSSFELFSGYR